MLLLHIFPEGVEELDGAYAVYAEEPPLGFDVVEVDDVAEGWEDGWREFHHGVRVGRFWVGPPWQEPTVGAEAIVIDPGRAFGTGAHATTRLTLELLQELRPASLLDVGCGSGVLSVAAAKLGFAPVHAVDIDEVAIESARANAAENDVAVHVGTGLQPSELAVMNIALDVVERMLTELPVRRAITSGYLERDEPQVDGWHGVTRRVVDGWAVDLLEHL